MRSLWDQFHSDYRQVSNASIICEDGVIYTHKLMLANISKLLKLILSDIPAADEVTLYLHNFPKKHVEEFFVDLLQKKESSHGQLCSTFGIQSQSHFVKKEVGIAKICDDEIKEENDSIEPETWLHEHRESTETDTQRDIKVKKVKVKESEKDLIKNPESKRDIDEDVERSAEETIKELEKDLIINPSTKREIIFNKTIKKKIDYEKGIAFFKSGRANSFRHAAATYGLSDKTLKKLVLSGKSYEGPGSGKLTRFSKEEEKIIANRALALSSTEENTLTFKLLRDVIQEEAEVVKINQPERSNEMTFTAKSLYEFAYALAERNGILDLCTRTMRRDRDNRRTYECEICYRSFTFKNSLVSHQKRCHSFLYT